MKVALKWQNKMLLHACLSFVAISSSQFPPALIAINDQKYIDNNNESQQR